MNRLVSYIYHPYNQHLQFTLLIINSLQFLRKTITVTDVAFFHSSFSCRNKQLTAARLQLRTHLPKEIFIVPE